VITVFAIAFAVVLRSWGLTASHGRFAQAIDGTKDPVASASTAAIVGSPIANINCDKDGATSDTSIVEVQPDGLHLLIDTAIGRPTVTISSGGRSVTIEPPDDAKYPFSDVVSFPPGEATIACGTSEDAMSRSISIRLVDGLGTYHDATLACDFARVVETASVGSFDNSRLSVVEGIRSVTPGVLPSDDVSYGEYRLGEWGGVQYRIMRDGFVVATVGVSSSDDTTVVGPLYACPDANIG
jgi:hypothetical protein